MWSRYPEKLLCPPWNNDDYDLALHEYNKNPPHLPEETEEEIEEEIGKLKEGLKKLGLFEDIQKLLDNGVLSRHKLVTLEEADIQRLGLEGNLEQYKSLYGPALEECSCDSRDCELFGTFTHEYLVKCLERAKRWRDKRDKKEKEQEMHELIFNNRKLERGPGKKRVWSDPQMYTHAALLPGIFIASIREPPILELVVLQGIVCVLSLIWHRNHEHEDAFAKIEHFFAHGLFAYGLSQTLFSPGLLPLLMNITCAFVTSTVYVVTYDNRALWERWHAIGLHVVPGLWSVVIASMHERFLF